MENRTQKARPRHFRYSLHTLLAPLCLGGLVFASSHPALGQDKKIVLRDWTGRGFAPDVVHYQVEASGAAGMRVQDEAGNPVVTQVTTQAPTGLPNRATLSFVTALPANGQREFVVKTGTPAAPAVPVGVQVTKDGPNLVLSNELFSLRVPAPGRKTFDKPVAASTLQAPLLAFKDKDGPWRGSSQMLSSRMVTSQQVELTARGPVFSELAYELVYQGGGYFRCKVRVELGVPLAKITEEYDPGTWEGGEYSADSWELNLASGWSPDSMEVASTAGNGRVDMGRVEPLDKLASKPSWYLIPDSAWGPISQLGLFGAAAKAANATQYPMAGIVPLHKGDWRHMNALEVQSKGVQDVRVRFPLRRRHASWLREVTSETSPFSMHEHEPGLSATYGRRHWGLVLAQPAMQTKGESGGVIGPFYQARLFYGVVGLDRYKDFVLDWPDNAATYPRLYRKAATLKEARQELEGSALPEKFKSQLLSGSLSFGEGTDAAVQARIKDVRQRLLSIAQNVLVSPTTGHHWTAPQYLTAAVTDDLLGSPQLPAEVRQELRTRVALICHLWEDADIISYANGSHSGNPNMGTARFSPMVAFLPLVPDHPLFATWRDHMAQYLEYKTASQTAPGGGYFEYGSAYHMHGFARVMNVLPALESAGMSVPPHLARVHEDNWKYYINLLSPVDSRWRFRVIPGVANSGPGFTEHFAEAAGVLAKTNPQLAAELMWAWEANGASDRNDAIHGINGQLVPAGLRAREPQLKSEIYPGIGVIFRAHQGPDETYMFFRAGNNWSHWPEDQGHMVLMSRGATLLPFQPYQYWSATDKAFEDKNLLRFGHPENKTPHAWPDANILEHAFGPQVDYALASMGFPDWYITPGASPEHGGVAGAAPGTGSARKLAEVPGQQQGAFDWNRQILFLKGRAANSPNYFVVRDAVEGQGKLASWFYLNLLGNKAGVEVGKDKLKVETEWPVKLDVHFPGQGPLQAELHEERQSVSLGGYTGPSWWRGSGKISPWWTQRDGNPVTEEAAKTSSPNFWEQHTLLRMAGAPGQGYFWLIYPRKAGEIEPTVSSPAPGVMKIGHPEGADTVFLSDSPISYLAEGISFQGKAGTVRVGSDGKVTLALTSGTGRVGYKGLELVGTAPLERTFSARQVRPQVIDVPVSASGIPWRPNLAGHAPLSPGFAKAEADGNTEYLVQATTPGEVVSAVDGNITVKAQRALLSRVGEAVRFVVPDAAYARLSWGHVGVKGQGPFDLTFTPSGIAGTVAGERRTLVTTFPAQVNRPMLLLNGQRWFAGWADDHSIYKGTATPQFGLAFGVEQGSQRVEVKEWSYPTPPPLPERRKLN